MKFNPSAKIFSWYYFIVITLVLVVGTLSSFATFNKVSKSTQETLLKNVASIASVFETSGISDLAGDESDLNNPIYVSLKNKLEKIPEINDEISFIYLWRYRDGNVYFSVDSEPVTSEDYSPPGQIYSEATALNFAMFLENLPSGIEISSDRWGTWLSAFVPIKETTSGELIAVMGVDMSASKYFRTIYVYTAIPVLTTIFVLVIIIVGMVLRKREQEFLTFKSELVAIASHEIRSPLTGISWLTAGLLKSGDNLSQNQQDDIRIIKNKSEALLLTINDLLDGTVAEKINHKKLIKKSINIKTLLEEIAANFFLILAEKNNQLVIDASITPELTISGDPDKLTRMFNNLISNAVKYSKNGGIVIVAVSEQENNFIFSIKDEGIGISLQDQRKIFNGFFRAENAKKVTNNGTGLGLHYVNQIVELHNGKVWCESKEGVGSTFYVALPKN